GLALLFGLGMLLRLRRRSERRIRGRREARYGWLKGALLLIALPLSLGLAGCDCGGDTTPTPDATCATMDCGTTGICCEATAMCVAYDEGALCSPGYACAEGGVMLDSACLPACATCEPLPPLPPGLLATHLDMVVRTDGTLMLSGYAAGAPPRNTYGDLVVGVWNTTISEVAWQIVDGVPDASFLAGDPAGWRGGVALPGDDVGRWTSIGERSSDGRVHVSYYDRTNGALKIASSDLGVDGAWAIHTVDGEGDAGRFTSLAYTAAGEPVVAYMAITPPETMPGRPVGHARVAFSTVADPTSPADWILTEANTAPMACRPEYCADGAACLESGDCVMPTADCATPCADDQACVAAACVAALPDPYVEELPPSTGLYNSLVALEGGGFALTYYDRSTGNLFATSWDGTIWGAPILIDGHLRADAEANTYIGDSGQAAKLFVDAAGAWHVVYVDGGEEVLRYARIESGFVTARYDVDDGSTVDGTTRHPDGRHVVGDDASIVVTDSGEVRIAYQDSTAQRAVMARGPGDGTWTLSVLDEMDSTGYWLEQELTGSTSFICEWWRRQGVGTAANGVRVLVAE
ncbi:MAG: hypothetical protein OEY14_12160, partial [Myxococcales bacterium]|nr:hypothetical protein [Myxococcales bacterium]